MESVNLTSGFYVRYIGKVLYAWLNYHSYIANKKI